MRTFYVLRYAAGVPLHQRPHAPTLDRWETHAAADAARQSRPNADLLEVHERQEETS